MTVPELKELLAKHDITPVRSRGQNFLLDETVVSDMCAAAGVTADDAVLEIGPGPGILTAELLRRGAAVTTVELDLKMCALLEHRFAGKLNLVQADILAFDKRILHVPYKLIANIPYNITSEVLTRFLTEEPRPESLTLMVQRAVADRVLAKPGDMSSLAILVQTLGEVRRVRNVPAGAFYPAPKVDSAVIHIRSKSRAELAAFFGQARPQDYFALVRAGFASKRKQLKNSLDQQISRFGREPDQVFAAAGIKGSDRPEELAPAGWKRLAEALTS